MNDVLDFRKLDANLFQMTLKPVDLDRLIESACRHCRGFLLPTVGLQFRVVPAGAMLQLDARRIHQILTNGLRCVRVGELLTCCIHAPADVPIVLRHGRYVPWHCCATGGT